MNNYNNYIKNNNYLSNMLPNDMKYNNNIFTPYEGYISGNMFKNLYNSYKINTPYEITPMNEQAKMLTHIDALSFALIDLNLYLDNHPNDREAINLFNKYRVQKNELQKIYEDKYGPLDLSSDSLNTYPWAWDNRPWPWEN